MRNIEQLALETCLVFLMATIHAQIPYGGYSLQNDRLSNDIFINKQTISTLRSKWVFTAYGMITSTPAVAVINGVNSAFFADWSGWVYSVNFENGGLIWSADMTKFPGAETNSHCRGAPAIDVNTGILIIGDVLGGRVYAINAFNGNYLWHTVINNHIFAQVTQSPTIYNGVVFVGANSGEEGWTSAGIPNYQCCTFRGSFSALNLTTGNTIWTFYAIPDNGGSPNGYSGGGVWGSNPAIDPVRNVVYIGTGNNYKVPAPVQSCINANPANAMSCQGANNYASSMLAIRIADGSLVWSHRVDSDVWNSALTPNWQTAMDWDFAQGAILYTINNNGQTQDVVSQGNKGGIFYTMNRDTGALVWKTSCGPGNSGGGMMWGSAADDTQIYAANANAGMSPFQVSNGQICNSGFFFALDKTTGAMTWSVCSPVGSQIKTPITVVKGGVIFGAPADNAGHMYALDAANGNILWAYQTGATIAAGAGITDGVILWASGYQRWGQGTYGTNMYAFEVPARYQGGTTPPPVTNLPTLPIETQPPTTSPPTYPPNYHIVQPSTDEAGDFIWVPSSLTINVGDTVLWTNLEIHTVYQTESATSLIAVPNGIQSGVGITFQYTFENQDIIDNKFGGNIFYFRCARHSTMFLQLNVQGSTYTPPPTTTLPIEPTTSPDGYGGECPAPGYASSLMGLRYFVDPLPIPNVAVPISSTATEDVYNITITDFTMKIHSDIAPVKVRGYEGQMPGPTIIAQENKTVTVNWINNLSLNSTLVNVQSIPGGLPMTNMVTHLHGGDNTAAYDGLPEEAVGPGKVYQSRYYNRQNPTLLYYHDHAMGITRANVYMGLTGFYILRSPSETIMGLPSGQFEVPLLIQDRILSTDGNGNPYLYYPQQWQMLVYGQVMLVNGKIWPVLNVQPTTYRLRIINGSNGRYLHLLFSNSTLRFAVIANDQGFVTSPVLITSLTLAPAERVDILINFCEFAGQDIILQNTANAPYPGDQSPNEGTMGVDPCLQGRVMLFRVGTQTQTSCPSNPPIYLSMGEKSPILSITPSQSIRTRDLLVYQNIYSAMPMVGIRFPNGTLKTYSYEDPPTEFAKAGTVETWRIWNLSPDAHPMHVHSSNFKIVSRQAFDVNKMMTTGEIAFNGTATPPLPYEAGAKDVITSFPGTVVTILIQFTKNVGKHLWHCHILEHEDNHMMRPLIITP